MKRIICLLCMCISLTSCSCANRVTVPQQDKTTLTVAVPASDKEIISTYLNAYKDQTGVDFRIIDISGDGDDIHRFYVSTFMDDKFNADIYFLEDKWISEFAACGYIDEIDLDGYDFIPAVAESVEYNGKAYAMPVYADAYAEFAKRGSTMENMLYIENGADDYLAGVHSFLAEGADLNAAVGGYESMPRLGDSDDFLFGDYGRAKGWLTLYNDMKNRHIVEAVNISIDIDNTALLRTKAFAISKGTQHRKEAQALLEFFLGDAMQKWLMTEITAIPVLKSFYQRDDLYDITPHILDMDGLGFSRLKASEHHTVEINKLDSIISQPGEASDEKLALVGRLIGE